MIKKWMSNTVIFLASQIISLFGSSLVQYAITWYITLTTKSGVYTTFAIICGFLPTLFLSPFAGVWADRYNRKYLIVIADACIAACTLIIAIFFMTGNGSIELLLGALAIRAVGSAVQTPCVGAMLPDLVPENQLTRVNGINGSIQSLTMLISPLLSGALLSLASIEVIFFIDVITAIIAIFIMLIFVKIQYNKPKETATSQQSYLNELKQGITYILEARYLRNFFLFCSIFFLMASPVAFLTPLQVTRVFGDNVIFLTLIEVAFSVGMLVGGIAISIWGGFKNRVHTMAVSGILMGICTIALSFPKYFWFYLSLMSIFGVAIPLFNTPSTVLLQEKVEPEYLGRVFGVMTMISSGFMPMGMLIFGPAADIIQIEWLLLGTGLVILVASAALIFDKQLLKAGTTEN